MTPTPIEHVRVLADELMSKGLSIFVEDFSDGAVRLDLEVGKRSFVLMSSGHRYHVDELFEDDDPFRSFRFTLPDFESGRAKLFELMNSNERKSSSNC